MSKNSPKTVSIKNKNTGKVVTIGKKPTPNFKKTYRIA